MILHLCLGEIKLPKLCYYSKVRDNRLLFLNAFTPIGAKSSKVILVTSCRGKQSWGYIIQNITNRNNIQNITNRNITQNITNRNIIQNVTNSFP